MKDQMARNEIRHLAARLKRREDELWTLMIQLGRLMRYLGVEEVTIPKETKIVKIVKKV